MHLVCLFVCMYSCLLYLFVPKYLHTQYLSIPNHFLFLKKGRNIKLFGTEWLGTEKGGDKKKVGTEKRNIKKEYKVGRVLCRGLVFSINARAKISNSTGEARMVSHGPRWNSFYWLVWFVFGKKFGPVGAFHTGFVKCFIFIL